MIGRIAARQHGVVTTAQLLGAGVHSSGISKRVAAGRLHRAHRGVYAVGHPRLSNEGRWMAAVLACGPGAVLSHRSAGELWGIDRPRARRLSGAGGRGEHPPPVDVTVAGIGGRKGHRGIRVHRSSTLSPATSTTRSGIPVTTPPRTLSDLRRSFPRQIFNRALREAEFLGLAIGDGREGHRTRSELEERFLALVRRHRLPQPRGERAHRSVHRRLSLAYRAAGRRGRRLESHGTRSAFEADRARDARLKLLGFDVLRFTWRQIADDRGEVASLIREVLRRAA